MCHNLHRTEEQCGFTKRLSVKMSLQEWQDVFVCGTPHEHLPAG